MFILIEKPKRSLIEYTRTLDPAFACDEKISIEYLSSENGKNMKRTRVRERKEREFILDV